MRSTLALVLLTATLACTETADGPDLTGTWRITAHTTNATGCTPGAAATDPPFIEFHRETILGQVYFQWAPCTAPGTCESTSLLNLSYGAAVEGGFAAQAYAADGTPADCALSAVVSTAVVGGDGGLTIETRVMQKNGATVTTCNDAAAMTALNANELTCGQLDVMTAVRN